MKSAMFAAVPLLLLVGCQFIRPLGGTNTKRNSDWATVHIRVDDEIINKGFSFEIIEPVYWAANIYDGEAEYNSSLAGFTREQRQLFAIEWYFMEVDNGGHDQFYYNSTGIVWKDALAGFRAMGIDEAAAILEEAAKRMGGDPSLDRETRSKQMDLYQPQFEDLDDRLYALEGNRTLGTVMDEYIRKNRNAFYFDGDVKKPKSLIK